MNSETTQDEKTATVVIKKIRDAILDDIFKPGDWLPEVDLAKRFEVSRSPIREALQALEKEGTVISEPYKGAVVKPLSPEEALDIAEMRLAVITLGSRYSSSKQRNTVGQTCCPNSLTRRRGRSF